VPGWSGCPARCPSTGTSVAGWARRHGADTLSLNVAAFRGLLEPDADGHTVAAWLVHRLDGRFGIQMDSLRRFNATFQPTWTRRYLVYRSPADLPAIGLAALSAEGFLPFDPTRDQPTTPAPAPAADGAARPHVG
jgi:lysyl-tRNA synthetase class 2